MTQTKLVYLDDEQCARFGAPYFSTERNAGALFVVRVAELAESKPQGYDPEMHRRILEHGEAIGLLLTVDAILRHGPGWFVPLRVELDENGCPECPICIGTGALVSKRICDTCDGFGLLPFAGVSDAA